jgi:hypothetical protein
VPERYLRLSELKLSGAMLSHPSVREVTFCGSDNTQHFVDAGLIGELVTS